MQNETTLMNNLAIELDGEQAQKGKLRIGELAQVGSMMEEARES